MIKSLISTEEDEQKALFQWASFNKRIYPFLLHIPNGGYRVPREAKKLKTLGVRAGVSDIFFAYPTQKYAGLWIELKRTKSKFRKPTDSQQKWLELMNAVGYKAICCAGWEEARNEILNYLEI